MMSSSRRSKRKADDSAPAKDEAPAEDEIFEEESRESEESEESMVLVDDQSKFSFFNIIYDILG